VTDELDLKELSDRAGVTPRTVHYYIQQGLLPPAGATGPGARYSDTHLLRLRLIRLLQREHLPLAEIGRRIKPLDDTQVRRLLREREERSGPPGGSALDYVRRVLAKSSDVRADESARLSAPAFARPEPPGRSQWDRFTLADGIEVHVRRPVTRDHQRRLDRLLAIGKELFTDE
jgi:DNA-binding transcriptional MerR regulator